MKSVRKTVVVLMWLAVGCCVAYSITKGMLVAATGWVFGAAMAIPVFFAEPRQTRETEAGATREGPRMLSREESVALFREKYGEMLSRLDISENGGLVSKMSSVFSLIGVDIQHFCWRDGNLLYFFPQWDSIEGYLQYAEYVKPYKPGDEDNIYVLSIPMENIEYFKRGEDYPDASNPEALEAGMVVLQYYNAVNQIMMLLFSSDSYDTFSRLIPEKEYRLILSQKYPKSSKQIVNIRDQLQSLKELWEQGLIGDEEYADKRKILLTLL